MIERRGNIWKYPILEITKKIQEREKNIYIERRI